LLLLEIFVSSKVYSKLKTLELGNLFLFLYFPQKNLSSCEKILLRPSSDLFVHKRLFYSAQNGDDDEGLHRLYTSTTFSGKN